MRRLLLLSAALGCLAASPVQKLPNGLGWIEQANGTPATVDLNFAQGIYQPIDALEHITGTAAAAFAQNPDGTWSLFPGSQPRITAQGVLIEEQRANWVPNSILTGAANGSPGTRPTGWPAVGSDALTGTISGLGTVSGLQALTWGFAGTTSTAGSVTITPTPASTIAATYGQTWTFSIFLLNPAGSTYTNPPTLQILEANSGGTTLVTATSSNLTLPTSGQLGASRFQFSYTVVSPTAAFLQARLAFPLANSVPVNFSVELAAPQLEQNSLINSSVASATVNSGGTLYVGSGTMTWSGTGCPTNPVLNVTETGGIINAVTSVANAGSCTTFPAAGATTWTPGGGLSTGSGASFNLVPTNNAAAAFATSPIRTAVAAVTRTSDVLSMLLPAGATSLSGASMLASVVNEAPISYTVVQIPIEIDDGTNANRVILERVQQNGAFIGTEIISSVNTNVSFGTIVAANTLSKIGLLAVPNSLKGVLNNGTIGSASPTGLAPGLTILRIGSNAAGASFCNCYISRIVVAPASLLNN